LLPHAWYYFIETVVFQVPKDIFFSDNGHRSPMNHDDHLMLIRQGVPQNTGGVWADFGSGGGAFTFALAELLGAGSVIYSVDRDGGVLKRQAQKMARDYPEVTVHYLTADFTHPLSLPSLDGILMANSLHFVRRKEGLLERVKGYLKPDGRLLIVEYNTDRGNLWVPHPLSFTSWQALAGKVGFRETELLATRPSSFLGEFFSAVSR
jgi:ubiquinone/menaquinone biosynthesis C-methylase UbiE